MARKHRRRKEELSTNAMLGIATVLGILVLITAYAVGFQAGKLKTGGAATVTAKEEVDAAGKTAPSAPTPAQQPPTPPPPSAPVEVSAEGAPIEGDPDAPVTIIEWSDFQCPFCGRFFSQTLGKIRSEYIDTGKVKFAYRDFPLSFHQNAQKAAEAGKCAFAQGNDYFWQLHDKMMSNQQALSVDDIKGYAATIEGLDTEAFNTCLDSGAMTDAVKKDFDAGRAAGVRGTPGFFVNGKPISGAQPYSVFKQAIDAELAKN
ncbi:DsbA family protein [Candidatus Woesearchaeota archaeon]|nr:MAG: DsbA family protein [Candidatus Woesearchaeota archaeon]